MLTIIAGTFCMLLAFSSMWLSWYVLMPHKRIHLPDGSDTLGEVVGGTVGEIIQEELNAIAPHKTSRK
ncbi:MAG: hypothetical protein Q7J20_06940 [Candidatus Nitrotoga sp.]|nr:hypothetical protein [Candidatus Nitrotoga sp.]MDO9447618.1 hypothetical protein [Candidatus Nitrotoga sp.]MDP3496654.1 hypothetical protein [Candidatus Nitrotoga sp.]